MTRSETKTEAVKAIDDAPDYVMPAFRRLCIRFINGVPEAKAEALFHQEAALAKAKAGKGGRIGPR